MSLQHFVLGHYVGNAPCCSAPLLLLICLRTGCHMGGPVGLLARIVAVGRVPTAVEYRLFATAGAPLLLLCLRDGLKLFRLRLLLELLDGALGLLGEVGLHLLEHGVDVLFDLGELLLVAPLHLLQLQLEALDGGLGAPLGGQLAEYLLNPVPLKQ